MSNKPPIEMKPKLISAKEFARLLSVSDRTLWRLASAGKLLTPVYIGGSTRWKLSEVEQWIEDGCPCQRTSTTK